MLKLNSFHRFISGNDRRSMGIAVGVLLAAVGALIGLTTAVIGPIHTGVLLVALAGAIWATWNLEHATWAIVAIIALLPFATIPVKVVLTPTLLDLAMAAALLIYMAQWMTGERRRLATTPVHPFIVLFMILAVFSFVAGLRYAGLTTNVVRKFAEMLLSMAFALVVVDAVRTFPQLRRLVLVIIVLGAIAAAVGIVLWLLPDELTERILVRLAIIGYPDGGVIQYIEQNPELAERAIGTSVNPNSLGGFLVLVTALTAPQLLTEHPITGRQWHVMPLLIGMVVCLILTFSRGSMAALAVALLFIASLRYRKLLLILGLAGLVLVLLPWSQTYIARFIEGVQGEDLATQMRVGEYTDALILITRYPLFGVGFSGAPDIDIYLGVSSVYLTIAENMGLLGLAAFGILMAAVFIYAWRARTHLDWVPGMRPIWLGLCAALIGALIGGMLDHYFFNLEFHHAITIFWLFVGMLLASTRIVLEADSQGATTRSLEFRPSSGGRNEPRACLQKSQAPLTAHPARYGRDSSR